MKYYYKFFLWENGALSTDYTEYLTIPIFYEDRLNEELDTAEVILDRVPTSMKRDAFAPKTKFRIFRCPNANFSEDDTKTFDMIVETDNVEIYVGCPELCCHRINLIEASAIAQGMHVDNIALTYELQDVDLNYKTYRSDTTLLNDYISVANGGSYSATKSPSDPSEKFEYLWDYGGIGTSNTYYFKNSYFYEWSNYSSIGALKLNLSAREQHEIEFTIPTLMCQGCPNKSVFEDLFEMNTVTRVYRTECLFSKPLTETRELIKVKIGDSDTESEEVISGATSFEDVSNSACLISGNYAWLRTLELWSTDSSSNPNDSFEDHYVTSPAQSTALAYASSSFSKKISFTTTALTEAEIESGKRYLYEIEVYAKPYNTSSFKQYYSVTASCFVENTILLLPGNYNCTTSTSSSTLSATNVSLASSFNVTDLSSEAIGGTMLMKGVKYSCYDLLRKALLTVDTQIIDNTEIGIDSIEYPIIVDEAWLTRLKTAKVQETTLETKNLWEVLIQIGYYLHAIPYLEFATDGTDRFVLSFKQLGGKTKKTDTSTKITIYNSQNLSDYFTQYDSYVTNIFSPQNLVDEWLVITTEDDTTLISNNTALLKTKYGISEIVEFEITYDGDHGGDAGTESALDYIFEESIYECLSADYNVSPSKADALYYSLGDNKINGLTYTASAGASVLPMALKRIVAKLFGDVSVGSLKFNDLKFHIQYRTQDTMRISQVRPDLQNFMKNSSYDKFPHHEQFYGQQDKIVDSERLSLNLFGKLVRVGNGVYQCQENVTVAGQEKESGDLVEIYGSPYYVTEVENEWYPDAIFQKVTYSKNYNQLSQIVTIPSEPRFYEVSERSKVTREVRMFEFLQISTNSNSEKNEPRFLNTDTWKDFIAKLIFNKEECILPNYAYTSFVADELRIHKGSNGQTLTCSEMFPSSEVDRTDSENIVPKSSSNHADVIVPLLHFPLKDGITFEWDMEDNFKAGDSVDTGLTGGDTTDEAYYALQSVRYCDVMGRADLFRFKLFNKTDWTHTEAQGLPKACIDEPDDEDCQAYVRSGYTIGLDKDCREALSFNYQISLLYRDENNTGDFVTFSNMFGTKDSELYCCLLDEEVSMFDENTDVISANVLADSAPSDDEDSQTPTLSYSITEDDANEQIVISFSTTLDSATIAKVKSLVFYEIDDEGNKVSYLAKNFTNTLTALPNLYIYPVFAD